MALLERTTEVQALVGAVAAATNGGSGGVVLVEGPAGIGKTALVDAAREAAAAAGLLVLRARGGELEHEFAFGVVRQLFEPALNGAAPTDAALAGHARHAALALGLTASGGPPTGDPSAVFAALHGLYWLTANLAAARPLALLVDDAHWADSASMRFLAYLARRVEGLPVLVVVATRPRPEGDAVHAALAADAVPTLLTPRPLSREAVAEIVRALTPAADDEVCAACHAATGGNAFYARELARAIAERGLAPGAAERLRASSPERVTRVVGARLARLPADARALAHAVAVLGDDAPARHACALAELTPERCGAAADGLRAAGILTAAPELAFVHPIVRSAVDEGMPPGAAAAAHARAARLLAQEGERSERVAAQLLATEPAGDAWVCERLAAAAGDALARGAPETATAYGRRALAEPPPATERPRVLLALGTAVGLSADPADAPAHLREALRGLRDRAERLQAAVTLAAIRVHAGDSTESVEVLAGLLDEVAGYDDVLAAEIEAHLVSVARFHAGARRAAQPVAARVRARVEDDRNALPAVLVCDAVEHVMADGPAATVIALCERAFADPDEPMRFARNHTLVMAARALTAADALDLAARVLEQEMAEARGRGAAFEHAFASVFRADVHLHAGEIFAGEAGMRTAYAFTSEQPWPVGLQAITANLTWALLERGELDEAVALLAETALDGPAAGLPDTYTSAMLLHTRGRLGLARGLAEAAAIDLRECGRRLDDHAETNPALIPWRSGLARALHALGDVEGARALAADELARARGFAARGALGVTLRAVAHVGPPEDAVGTLHEAVDVLAGSPRRLEHGHALADLGVALLAQGRQADARTALRGALELAHLCGGAALEQRALARLREAGSRPRRALLRGPGALTPRERQVVELAAAGTPNREIADTLFVTVRTVEFHLARAYRKLEVAGRTELAEALTPRA